MPSSSGSDVSEVSAALERCANSLIRSEVTAQQQLLTPYRAVELKVRQMSRPCRCFQERSDRDRQDLSPSAVAFVGKDLMLISPKGCMLPRCNANISLPHLSLSCFSFVTFPCCKHSVISRILPRARTSKAACMWGLQRYLKSLPCQAVSSRGRVIRDRKLHALGLVVCSFRLKTGRV